MLTGGSQPRAIPPCTPERAAPTTPKLVDSAYESPASRRLLRRVRTGGVEGEWRTKGNSGEQKLGISHAKVASFRAGRKRHNTKLAERVDPTAAPPPPPLPIEHVPGLIGRPPQDKYLLPPLKLTRNAAAKGWDLPEARPKGFGLEGWCSCGGDGVVGGIRKERRPPVRESQSKKIKVERYDGMRAVRLTGKRMLPGWCRRAAWSIAHGQHNNELVKDEGAYGGDRAVLQRDTGHPSPLNANYGLCNGPGVDQDGNTISNLCSYSKQDSTEGAESVRHMGTDLHRLARTVFAAAKKAGVLSPETIEQGEFTAVQVRDYDGDNKAETNLHTDTRVEVDADGKPARQIDQIENTDVVIYSLGDLMLLWRKEYPGKGKGWLLPVVPLEEGSLFVWPTGPGTDDWIFKHGVFWPRKVDVGLYEGPPAGKRRIAFVFRCTRPRRWYGAAWPHRVVVPCAEEARA